MALGLCKVKAGVERSHWTIGCWMFSHEDLTCDTSGTGCSRGKQVGAWLRKAEFTAVHQQNHAEIIYRMGGLVPFPRLHST